MILERAVFPVLAGREQEFETVFAEAKQLLVNSPGFLSATLSRGIESSSTYLLLVEWQTLEDHTEGFRGSPAFTQWRSLLGHLFDGTPDVEHFSQVAVAP